MFGDPYEFDEETGSLLECFKRSDKVWSTCKVFSCKYKSISGSIYNSASPSLLLNACRHLAT